MKLGEINQETIKLLTDAELLNLFQVLKNFWQEKIVLEKILPSALTLYSEISFRKIEIEKDTFSEELDKLKESGFSPVYPSGEELGEEIVLDEVRRLYTQPIKLVEDAVNLVGGLVIWGKTKNDFEELIRIPPREELIRRIIFRLERAIQDIRLRKRMHVLDDFWGPFTDSLPLYDLCLVPSQSEILKMAEIFSEQELRAKNPQAAKQAKAAQKNDKITLGEFFFPLKTPLSSLMGYRLGEKYSVETMLDYLKSVAKRRDLETEIVPSFLQKKYDGLHCLVHKIDKNEVIIFSDDGIEITHRLPNIEKELIQMKPNEFILDTELEGWENEKHQSREDVAAYIHRKDKADDSDFLLNCFDLLWIEKQGDIHKLPVSERIKLLNDLDFPQSTAEIPDLKKGHLNLAPTSYANSAEKIRKALVYFSKAEGSEGAMVKYADMVYDLGGSSTSIVKLKTYAEVHGIVWKINSTKVPTVFNYDFAVAFSPSDKPDENSFVEIKGKKFSKAGRSYDTSTKCKIGDIITIKFHTVNRYKDPESGTVSYHFYEPIFYEKRDPKEEPDSFTTIERIGKESGLMREKDSRQRFGGQEKQETIQEGIKPAFGSPGGKFFMAGRLVKLIPEHKIYAEPFAGGAAVFFRKKESQEEILNDTNHLLISTYHWIQNASDKNIQNMRARNWTVSREHFETLKNSDPKNNTDKTYKFLYTRLASYGGDENGTVDPNSLNKKLVIPERFQDLKKRLANCKIFEKDYSEILKDFDSPETFFYLDPPYSKDSTNKFKTNIDFEKMNEQLKSLKGKWLLSLNDSIEIQKIFSSFHCRIIKVRRTMNIKEKDFEDRELLISNYPLRAYNQYISESEIFDAETWKENFLEGLKLSSGEFIELEKEAKAAYFDFFLESFLERFPQDLREINIAKEKFPLLCEIIDIHLREQADPYMHYPSEEKTYTGIWQHHYRGRSVHIDQRNEGYDNELIGWTINDSIEGAIKEPVLTLAQAKKLDKQNIFKINYQTGEWKKRLKKGATKTVDVQIVSEKKAPEPHGWHDIEGVVKPGEVGATKEYPGVFSIILKGPIEYGSQKSWSHEYFYYMPPIDYRIVLRRLKLPFREKILAGDSGIFESVVLNNLFEEDDILEERLREAEISPEKIIESFDLSLRGEFLEAEKFLILPAKEKSLGKEGIGWVAIKPVVQEPYVLSSGAVKKNWIPPLGISALPKKIKKLVPDNLQYWKAKNNPDALKLRLELVDYFKERKIDFQEAQHRRDQCMDCSKAPVKEVLWAEGMAHAWFCEEHFDRWSKEHWDDIDYIKEVKDGIAAKKFSDNHNPNIKEALKTANFVIQRHWWKGPTVIRFGPSMEHFDLRIDSGEPSLMHMVLEYNPLEVNETSFYFKPCKDKSSMEKGRKVEYLKPQTIWNPTKETPAWISIISSGKVTILEDKDTFKKFNFHGRKFRGLWVATRESPKSEFWLFKRSELPEPK